MRNKAHGRPTSDVHSASPPVPLSHAHKQDKTSVQYGRIIDPYAGMEIQYSTPTFAFAAATLVAEK